MEEVRLVEAAQRLAVTYHQALKLVLTGRLKGRQVDGRHWVVDGAQLDLLERQKSPPGD